jgi:hypothetical protein
MFEEIPLEDGELKPSLFPVKHEHLRDHMVVTNGNGNQQKTIMTRILEQGKNAVSQQPSYYKLEEDKCESNNPAIEMVSFLTS